MSRNWLFCLIIFAGCVSSEVKGKIDNNTAQLESYVNLMNNGGTTPEEDQDLIRAMRIWSWSLNQYVNDAIPPDDVKAILESRE